MASGQHLVVVIQQSYEGGKNARQCFRKFRLADFGKPIVLGVTKDSTHA